MIAVEVGSTDSVVEEGVGGVALSGGVIVG
jgi:hypothetical protein